MKLIPFLPLGEIIARQHDDLLAAADDVLRSGHYLRGEQTAAFEQEFADYVGASYCVGVGNGLDALTLALLAMKQLEGWSDADEVIVPAMTFIATAQAVSRAGLHPVFCDVNDDALIDVVAAERLITPRTRALLPVHLYGRVADMESLQSLAHRHKLKILEDAAQAHGAKATDGQRAGSLGTAAAFSFYPGKNLGAIGDGGAVTTNDERLAERVRVLANYGAACKYHHDFLGLNSRLDELQAAFLRRRLTLLETDNAHRCHVAQLYNELITSPAVTKPYGGNLDSVFHIYPLHCSDRDALQSHLAAHGIETLIHYPLAVHQQQAYADHNAEHFPVAERIAATELSLPISPILTDAEAHYVAEAVNELRN